MWWRATSLAMKDSAVTFTLTVMRGPATAPKMKGFAVSFTPATWL